MDFLKRLFGKRSTDKPSESDTSADEAAELSQDVPSADGATPAPPPVLLENDIDLDDLYDTATDEAVPIVDGKEQKSIETAPLQMADLSSTRRLPKTEEIEAFAGASLSFGYALDVGKARENNQDALLAYAVALRTHDEEIDFGLFGIADGMGGHLDGEKASALVASAITEKVINDIYLPLLQRSPDSDDEGEDTELPIGEILMQGLHEANTTVLETAPGSGTTATIAVTLGNAVYIAHIGDSRAYLITGQTIEQITRDHSLAQRLFEVGQLTREEMGSFPRRNELYKVVGFTDDMDPDLNTRRLPPGSYMLLCSDGLWGEVPEIIMQDVVFTAPNPHVACQRLVDLANERGGHDNISVVVVQIPT